MSSPQIPFLKMNGIGNSILVVDLRAADRHLEPAQARAICAMDGLAFDQLMAIEQPRKAGIDAYVEIFNGDGSRAESCGNGTRCVAWAMLRHSPKTRLLIETAGGDRACERLGPTLFSVDMGAPRLGWRDIPLAGEVPDTARVALAPIAGLPPGFDTFAAVNMGNPHAVFFVGDMGDIPLATIGPVIEHHPVFPERANVSFAEVVTRDHIGVRVWERSAGATLACGSAACATLVAAVRAGLADRLATISLPGGDLTIAWNEADGHVIMTGGAELEHEGFLPAQLWDRA